MIKSDGRGVGALGVDGPVPDGRVKKNQGQAYVAKPGNGVDKPLGLVEHDTRIANLEARVEVLETLTAKLVEALAGETGETRRETDTSETRRETARETEFETGETRQSHDADQPWIAAGVSRATWFRKQRQAPLPANVVRLVPRSTEVAPPSVGAPKLRAAP
jgi:hypothetical protein